MNYKLLFPTYRNRYRFVADRLQAFARQGRRFQNALNLGAGEGDYDAMIAQYCECLHACDINEQDIAYARQLNAHLPHIEYRVENALQLSYPDASFDLLISVEVIEHVGQPERMMQEVGRVLQPGGLALITFPSLEFPFAYDPVNWILFRLGSHRHIAQGAYAFGHEYLVLGADFKQWATRNGLQVVEERNLSGALVALSEMYWTGWAQRLFKANAANLPKGQERRRALRPSTKEPALTALTDAFLRIDSVLFGRSRHSVGKGFVLKKIGYP